MKFIISLFLLLGGSLSASASGLIAGTGPQPHFMYLVADTSASGVPVVAVTPAIAPSPVVSPAPAVDPNISFIEALIAAIGGMKGASAITVAAIVVQLLLQLFQLPALGGFFNKIGSQYKLLIVLALTLVSGVISLRVSGLSFGAALIQSSTLSAFMVLANQVYKQFIEQPEPLVVAAAAQGTPVSAKS